MAYKKVSNKDVAVKVTKGNKDAKKKIHASPWLSIDAVNPVADNFDPNDGASKKESARNPKG